MKTKLVALALVALIAITVTAVYSLNQLSNTGPPPSTPTPTEPPIPSTPTDQNSTVTEWAQFNTTYPTALTIISPQNQSRQTSSIILQVNVTTSFWVISSVYYKADWLGDGYHRGYSMNNRQTNSSYPLEPALTLTSIFTGIPNGNHTIEVIANYHDGSKTYGTANFIVGP